MDIINDHDYVKLSYETDFIKYLEGLNNFKDSLSIIVAVKDTAGSKIGEDGFKALNKLGLTSFFNSKTEGVHWRPYIYISEKGTILSEEIGKTHTTLNYKGIICGKKIDIFSAPWLSGNESSVIIDGDEYSVNKRGINIVLIDSEGVVIDSVAFDTHSPSRLCFRRTNDRYNYILPHKAEGYKNRNSGLSRQRLALENIISSDQIDRLKSFKKKTKVRFFFWGAMDYWLTIDSLVKAFLEDESFDTLVVLQNNAIETISTAGSSGANIILDKEYNIKNDQPDIAIFNRCRFYKDSDCIKLKILVEAGLVNGALKDTNIETVCNDITGGNEYDAVIVERNIYETVFNNTKLENWFTYGHPKFDKIYNSRHLAASLPSDWKKLNNKKIILWAFDHNWYLKSFTFDLFVKDFIQYFGDNQDIGLIIRPHWKFMSEMKQYHIWNSEDIDILKAFCKNSKNIVWDDRIDYGLSYALADAVITDINCGITVSALTLDVPLAYTTRSGNEAAAPLYPVINESLYELNNMKDFVDFAEMIRKNEDPLAEKREVIKKKYISNFDGQNGMRIKNFIKEKFRQFTKND